MMQNIPRNGLTHYMVAAVVVANLLSACGTINAALQAHPTKTMVATTAAPVTPTLPSPTPSTTPKPTATDTQVPTITPTLMPTVVTGVLFPESFTVKGEAISFSVSTGAKEIFESIIGQPAQSFNLDPEALKLLRAGLVSKGKELYAKVDIRWDNRIEFIAPDKNEIRWVGNSVIVNSADDKHWDTNEPINLFVVTRGEFNYITDRLKALKPEARFLKTKNYRLLEGDVLIFTDKSGTHVYFSVDGLKDYDLSERDPSSVAVSEFIIGPSVALWWQAGDITLKISRRTGTPISAAWIWEVAGCDMQDVNKACEGVTIK